MIRLNVMLFAGLLVCALSVVTSQHQARNLFVDLQSEQERGRDLEIEFGQLQLEQSTWATHGRVEKIASKDLDMVTPSMNSRSWVIIMSSFFQLRKNLVSHRSDKISR